MFQDISNQINPNCARLKIWFSRADETEFGESLITNRKKTIYYNEMNMNKAYGNGNNRWQYLFTIAHEIGHHINSRWLDSLEQRKDFEIMADRFAGFILFKLGATLDETGLALKALPKKGNSIYPDRIDRINAANEGWHLAEKEDAENKKILTNTIEALKRNADSIKRAETELKLKDCYTRNKGDYCFTNSTRDKILVCVGFSSMIVDYRVILDPGESKCLYELKAAVYVYTLHKEYPNAPGSWGLTYSQGQFNIVPCKPQTYYIQH